MGQRFRLNIFILIICLLISGYFIHRNISSEALERSVHLVEFFSRIDGWEKGKINFVGDDIATSLDLDDYLYADFKKGSKYVSLYIGYYETLKKVGSAHSPLVCFPGQGWNISETQNQKIKTDAGEIHLASMIVGKGGKDELVLYWFQAYDRTSPGTFMQKVNSFLSKVRHKNERNAFVRITIPLTSTIDFKAFETGREFLQDFYPKFLRYILIG